MSRHQQQQQQSLRHDKLPPHPPPHTHTHPFTRPFPTNPFARQGSRGPDPQPPTTTHLPRPAAQQGTGLLQALFYFFSEGRGTFFQCRPYWHTPDDSCSWGRGRYGGGRRKGQAESPELVPRSFVQAASFRASSGSRRLPYETGCWHEVIS